MSVTATESTPALALLASCELDDGRRWGEAALPWQWEDASAILDPAGPRYHFVTRPRGASKTTDLGAITLSYMLSQAPNGARLYALAADRDQGKLLLDAVKGFAMRTPLVGRALDISADRVSVADRDVVLNVLAADAAGSWGLRPHFVVLDELAQWAVRSDAQLRPRAQHRLLDLCRRPSGRVVRTA
jgi:phage terminase large subunit-like protein